MGVSACVNDKLFLINILKSRDIFRQVGTIIKKQLQYQKKILDFNLFNIIVMSRLFIFIACIFLTLVSICQSTLAQETDQVSCLMIQ